MKQRARRFVAAIFFVSSFFPLVQPLRGDEETRRVQEELRKRNIFFGDIDGRKTNELSGALRRYQEHKGFAPTGEMDAPTLQSLGLETEPETAAQHQQQSAWPDTTVLKSDSRKEANAGGENSPPPIAELDENARREKSENGAGHFAPERVREFIESYLRNCETNDLAAEMSFYAEPLDYFDQGIVDRRFVEEDVKRYYKRWPERKYVLLSITQEPVPGRTDEALVKFRIDFTVKNETHTVHGQTDNFFKIKPADSSYKITSLREQRVRPAGSPKQP